jgi:type IV pilus assembly protein PilB
MHLLEGFQLCKTDTSLLSGLYTKGLINKNHLQILLKEWQKNKIDILERLILYGFLKQNTLEEFLHEEFSVSKTSITKIDISSQLMQEISFEMCKDKGFLPFFENEKEIWVVSRFFLEDLPNFSKNIKVFFCSEKEFTFHLQVLFFNREKSKRLINYLNSQILNLELKERQDIFSIKDPIVELAESILEEAIFGKSSEVILILNHNFLKIHTKTEGIFSDEKLLFKEVGIRLLNRFKILSGMQIAETDTFLKGDFNFEDFIFSCTYKAEIFQEVFTIKVKQNTLFSLEEIGLSKLNITKLQKTLERSAGNFWLCSPQGQGKTTTLCSFANLLETVKKTCVIDEKVEIFLPNAIHVKSLEDGLKHNPETIFINDTPSSFVNIEAIMLNGISGIKTFGSIDGLDGFTLLSKFIALGISKELISSSLNCIISQRLFSKLCEECKVSIPLKAEELAILRLAKTDVKKIYLAGKCSKCNNTGYFGRTAIFEILTFDTELEETIKQGILGFAKKDALDALRRKGFTTLFDEARLKVLQGSMDIYTLKALSLF